MTFRVLFSELSLLCFVGTNRGGEIIEVDRWSCTAVVQASREAKKAEQDPKETQSMRREAKESKRPKRERKEKEAKKESKEEEDKGTNKEPPRTRRFLYQAQVSGTTPDGPPAWRDRIAPD